MAMYRAGFIGTLALALTLLAINGSPAGAQAAKGLVDPNTATETELQALPVDRKSVV